jgi:hypothetical protein
LPVADPRGLAVTSRAGGHAQPKGEQLYSAPIGALLPTGIKKQVGIPELAGLVETEKVGRARECRLGPATTPGEAGEWIEAHRRAWEGRLDRFVERAG